jgi:lysophospholipase L1-like esterase
LYFRLSPTTPLAPIRVLILGDSMAADCCGWGRGIYGYFTQSATVINYAMPWTSTKVFLQSAEFEKMLLITPDYVLIQYGFIDGGSEVGRFTTLEEFAENLKTIAGTVRGFGGVPILITLHAARLWDEVTGKLIDSWQDRNAVTRQVAAELNTHLIDLYQSTWDLFSRLGPEGTAFMRFDGIEEDFMHFSQEGGVAVSQLVVNELPEALRPYAVPAPNPSPKP